jgi:predicted TIM-barrel fold metal-dependent hydrolase
MRRRDVLKGGLAAGTAAAAAACAARATRTTAGRAGGEGGATKDVVVDIHCHTFNATDLPITGFLAHYVPGLADLSREVTDVPERVLRTLLDALQALGNGSVPLAEDEGRALEVALGRRGGRTDVVGPVQPLGPLPEPLVVAAKKVSGLFNLDTGDVLAVLEKLAQIVNLAQHSRAQIAATLATTYPTVDLFTPLLVDYDAWSEDHPSSALATQIGAHGMVARLSIQGRIGRAAARIHPFMAFDPLREARALATGPSGSLALVRRAIEEAGFIGVKVYPSVGFSPVGNAERDPHDGPGLDAALRALFKYCQSEDVPITAHASAANEYALGLHQLAAPARWKPVLEEFPKLRLNFGHFGHDHGVGDPRRTERKAVEARGAWMWQAAELIDRYPNVYADMSNSPLVYQADYSARFEGHLEDLCARFKSLPGRLMYGSDWWMNRFGPSPEAFVTAFTGKLEAWFGAAGRRNIMGWNALRFLGFADEGNRPAKGNRNRERLARLYGSEPRPAWFA